MRAYRKVDDQFQFRMDGGRMVLLGVGAALVLVLVFLLGVLVGKSVWGGRRPAPLPPAEAPRGTPGTVPETKPEDAADRRPDLTFYDDLKRTDRPTAEPAPRPQAPPAAAETPVPGRVRTEPAATPAAPPAPLAEATPPAGVVAPAPAAPVPTPTAPPPRAAPPAPSPEPKPAPRAPQPIFTIQVGSFRDRGAAEEQARQLATQGVGAQVVAASVEGGTWYRVQVGRFENRSDAEALYRNSLRPKGIQGFVTPR